MFTLNANKKNELLFFISGNLETTFTDHLNEHIDTENNEIKFISILESDNNYLSVLNTQGIIVSELLILPQSVLDTSNLENAFAEIDNDMLSSLNLLNIDLTFYSHNGKNIGVVLFNTELNNITNYINFDNDEETYIILFNNLVSFENINNDLFVIASATIKLAYQK